MAAVDQDNDDSMCRTMLAAVNSESNKALDFRLSSSVWTTLFRHLRNNAAVSRQRQDSIARIDDLLDSTTKRIFILVEGLTSASLSESGSIELRCAIQFLGNLVTNNESNKHLVWPRISSCFFSLLSCDDSILIKYSTMLFYNCIVGAPSLRDEFLYSHPNSSEILSLLLRSAADGESEWGLFTMECCLQSPSFMEGCYPSLSSDHRLFVLDILISTINANDKKQTTPECNIPFSNLQCVAKAFESRADVIFRTDLSVSPKEPVEVVRFAEVMCAASSSCLYNKELGLLSSLLCSALFMLKGIHMAGKDSSNAIISVKPSAVAETQPDESAAHPIDGLKCSLIRLMANMCWRNRTNQDKVREFDGIPLLLDCCKLDAKNPYIIQWVVYAIRNLCEGNKENQELIASMEKQGLADSYVKVEKDSESVAVRGNYSNLQQANQDILDLFS